jgi:hypothetical protein
MLLQLRPNPANQQHLALFKEMHKRSLNLSGRRVDLKNALSTEGVDIEMVFLTH